MEIENKPDSGNKFMIGGILAFALLGSVLTFVGFGSDGLMSQFSGARTTPSTVTAPVVPAAPALTSAANVSMSNGSTYVITWTKVSGVDYYVAIDSGNGIAFQGMGGWSIPLSQFTPGSLHIAKVKACTAGNPASCSSWSMANITVTAK